MKCVTYLKKLYICKEMLLIIIFGEKHSIMKAGRGEGRKGGRSERGKEGRKQRRERIEGKERKRNTREESNETHS